MGLVIVGRFDPGSRVRLVSSSGRLRPELNATLLETARADAHGTVEFETDVPMPREQPAREDSPYWVGGSSQHLPLVIRAVTVGADSAAAQPPLQPDRRWSPRRAG